MRTTAFAIALLLCCSAPLAAQSVKVEFRDGKVDINAQNATVRAILQEWGRQGGTRIINGDRVAGAPVTLELAGVYESQALEILLRGVSGYVVGPRQAASAGASGFDRILILPTSSAPRNPAPTGQAFSPPAAPQPLRAPSGADDPDDDSDVVVTQPNVARPGGLTNPRLPPPAVRQRVGQIPEQSAPVPPGPGARDRLQQIVEEDLTGEIAPESEEPVARPQNPFGVTPGSTRPGVIAPVPPPSQQRPTEQQQQR